MAHTVTVRTKISVKTKISGHPHRLGIAQRAVGSISLAPSATFVIEKTGTEIPGGTRGERELIFKGTLSPPKVALM